MSKSKVDWPRHLAEQLESGLSIKKYCEANELTYHSFTYHRRKSHEAEPPEPEQSFEEISVNAELTISLDGCGSVSITGIDPTWLPTILEACSHAISG